MSKPRPHKDKTGARHGSSRNEDQSSVTNSTSNSQDPVLSEQGLPPKSSRSNPAATAGERGTTREGKSSSSALASTATATELNTDPTIESASNQMDTSPDTDDPLDAHADDHEPEVDLLGEYQDLGELDEVDQLIYEGDEDYELEPPAPVKVPPLAPAKVVPPPATVRTSGSSTQPKPIIFKKPLTKANLSFGSVDAHASSRTTQNIAAPAKQMSHKGSYAAKETPAAQPSSMEGGVFMSKHELEDLLARTVETALAKSRAASTVPPWGRGDSRDYPSENPRVSVERYPKFRGQPSEDAEKYLQKIKGLATSNSYNLDGVAKSWSVILEGEALQAAESVNPQTWSKLEEFLISSYGARGHVRKNMEALLNTRQNVNERTNVFWRRWCDMARRIDPPWDTSSHHGHYLFFRALREPLQVRAWALRLKPFDTILGSLAEDELIEESNQPSAPSPLTHPVYGVEQRQADFRRHPVRPTPLSGPPRGPNACFWCGISGHTIEVCATKTRLCALCGAVGHGPNRCPEREPGDQPRKHARSQDQSGDATRRATQYASGSDSYPPRVPSYRGRGRGRGKGHPVNSLAEDDWPVLRNPSGPSTAQGTRQPESHTSHAYELAGPPSDTPGYEGDDTSWHEGKPLNQLTFNPESVVDIDPLMNRALPYISVRVGTRHTRALLDSGASICAVHERIIPQGTRINPDASLLCTASGQRMSSPGSVELTLTIKDIPVNCVFRVSSDLMEDMILGNTFMRDTAAKLDFLSRHVTLERYHLVCPFESKHVINSMTGVSEEHICRLQEAIALVPGQSILASIMLPKREQGVVFALLQPTWYGDEILVPCEGLIDLRDEHARVPLINRGSYTVLLPKGQVIGIAAPVTHVNVGPIIWEGPEVKGDDRDVTQTTSQGVQAVYGLYGGPPDPTGLLGKPPNTEWSGIWPSLHERSLSEPGMSRLADLLREYDPIFYRPGMKIPETHLIMHEINLVDGARPVFITRQRLSHEERVKVEDLIKELLHDGTIEWSTSPYSSPLVVVTKHNGSKRICNDFRALNKITVPDRYLPSRADEIITALLGRSVFSKLDLKAAYYHIPVKPTDRFKTAFAVPGLGQFQYIRLPFGLVNAPATFCRLMQQVMDPIRNLTQGGKAVSVTYAYMDDVIIASDDHDAHTEHLRVVFEAFSKARLTVSPDKCDLLRKSITFLGHLIDQKGIKPDPRKVDVIRDWPPLTSRKEVQRFLGLVNYYRMFIESFTLLAEPLRGLNRDDLAFVWERKHQIGFDRLKMAITTAPCLAYPDFDKEFIIYTDACRTGIGYALHQLQPDESNRPVAFGGRVTTKHEQNYSITELECLALYESLRCFHAYIHGKKVRIMTDHRALQFIREKKQSGSPRLQSWIQLIETYCPDIQYISGSQIPHVDAISRCHEGCSEPDHVLASFIQTTTSWDDLVKSAQAQDPWTQPLIAALKTVSSVVELGKWYILQEGVLFCQGLDNRVLAVPDVLRKQILAENHDGPLAGHGGIESTFSRIRSGYYWPDCTVQSRNTLTTAAPVRTANTNRLVRRVPVRSMWYRRSHRASPESIWTSWDRYHVPH